MFAVLTIGFYACVSALAALGAIKLGELWKPKRPTVSGTAPGPVSRHH